ncbi:MAG: hypothetical protein AAF492_14285, partial [Verrucomicrobiota bacterium]
FPNDEEDINCTPLDGTIPIVYGDPIRYRTRMRNCGASFLNDVIVFDKVPTNVLVVSAVLPTDTNGLVFYATTTLFTNVLKAPPFDHTLLPGSPGADWSQTPPADLSTVTWVAWYVPQLSSEFFPPTDPATEIQAVLNVVTLEPADPCGEIIITNVAYVETHNFRLVGETNKQAFSTVRTNITDDLTRVQPRKGEFSGDLELATLTPLTIVPDTGIYQLTVTNQDLTISEIFTNVTVDLYWTEIPVNGVMQYPSFVNVSGGMLTLFDPANGHLQLELGSMAPGESQVVELRLGFPVGARDMATYSVTAIMRGGDNLCEDAVATVNITAQVTGTPIIKVFKDDVLDVIPSGGTIDYDLQFVNIGTSPSENTWVVDRMPRRTVFEEAATYNGEEVWFTDKLPPDVPAAISVIDRVSFAVISTHFTPGILIDGGTPGDPSDDTWTSPFGEQTTWAAFKVDDPTLAPPQLIVGDQRRVSMRVRNDDDGTGSSTNGSPAGTLIFNGEAIFSDQNLQAIGNVVITTIEDIPGIQISKEGSSDIVNAGKVFTWTVDYFNNSHASNQLTTITEELPLGVQLQAVFHRWNDQALGGSPPASPTGQVDITVSPHVSVVTDPDGSQTVTVDVAPGLRGGDLAAREGGTLIFSVV